MGRNTIATIATKYCFYCSGGWMGGNTITIVGGNTIATVGGNTIATVGGNTIAIVGGNTIATT